MVITTKTSNVVHTTVLSNMAKLSEPNQPRSLSVVCSEGPPHFEIPPITYAPSLQVVTHIPHLCVILHYRWYRKD